MKKKLPIKEIVLAIILVLTSTFALKDLFKKGFFTSHDGIHQVARLYHFDQALKEGQLPVRYAGEALNGFGYPLFIFNYHTPWYIAEVLYKLIGSLTWSIKLTFFITYLLSGIIMFLWQRKYWGNLGGFATAILYLWAPYRFSAIFVRGALGDATCFIFFPLILWSIDNLNESKTFRWVVIGSLSLVLLLLSHAMIFFFFIPIVFLYSVITLVKSTNKFDFIKRGFLMFLIAGLLSIFYWLPAATERKFTIFKDTMNIHYEDHFPTLKQLIYSKWGYGFSFAGTDKDEMSFQVGITQWITLGLSIIILVYLKLKKRKDFNRDFSITGFFIVIFTYAVFIMLPSSQFLWRFFSRFLSLDFPFRILFLTTFSASVLAGFVIKNSGRLKWLLLIIIIIITYYGNRNHLKINDSLYWKDNFYAQIEKTTNTYDEYRPIWVDSERVTERPKQLLKIKGEGKLITSKVRPSWLQTQIVINKESQIILNKVYYPGWYVKINNKTTNFEYKNEGGLINFRINPGKYLIEAGFSETSPRRIVDIISGITFIICPFLLII